MPLRRVLDHSGLFMRVARRTEVGARYRAGLSTTLTIIFLVMGCTPAKKESTGSDQPVNMALPEVLELYFAYDKAEKKPPSKLTDFDKLKQTWPRGYKAIQSGEVIVIWGVDLAADKPIAYEKGTAEKGGLVLFGSGATKRLTPEAFNAAKN